MRLDQFRNSSFYTYPTATVAKLFWSRVAREPKGLSALEQTDSGWKKWTWEEIANQVEKTALGLRAMGIGPGDLIALYLPTSIQWEIFDYAISSLRAISV